jgi:sec-independent protein translocase protein TatA
MRFAGLGGWEWIIILLLVVLIFGVGKLANFGPALGKSIRGFRKSVKGDDEETPTTSTSASHQEKSESTSKPNEQ